MWNTTNNFDNSGRKTNDNIHNHVNLTISYPPRQLAENETYQLTPDVSNYEATHNQDNLKKERSVGTNNITENLTTAGPSMDPANDS
jgi:hypothetical protein